MLLAAVAVTVTVAAFAVAAVVVVAVAVAVVGGGGVGEFLALVLSRVHVVFDYCRDCRAIVCVVCAFVVAAAVAGVFCSLFSIAAVFE